MDPYLVYTRSLSSLAQLSASQNPTHHCSSPSTAPHPHLPTLSPLMPYHLMFEFWKLGAGGWRSVLQSVGGKKRWGGNGGGKGKECNGRLRGAVGGVWVWWLMLRGCVGVGGCVGVFGGLEVEGARGMVREGREGGGREEARRGGEREGGVRRVLEDEGGKRGEGGGK